MIETVVLRGDIVVLAKRYKGEACAVTYANRTQAIRKAESLGNGWELYTGRRGFPFYVGKTLA